MREKPMKLYHQNLWIQDFCSHVFPIIVIRFFIFAFKSRVHLWIDSCLHNYKIYHFRYSDLFSLHIYFYLFPLSSYCIIYNFLAKHCQAGAGPFFDAFFYYFLSFLKLSLCNDIFYSLSKETKTLSNDVKTN